jgi:lysophospholipase L1-like esterase
VPLIDLHAASIKAYESLGKAGCEQISPENRDGSIDHTHLNAAGGELFGRLVARELAQVAPNLKPHIPD